ncbi:MAG TPA: hypothetical protein VL856_00460 [Acidimicrobiia bacterium]|jgi:hypothetical protein|nr:hypothetical protein [Acidimicrobiia bacterium]
MKNMSRPRSAVERQARRNYVVFCAVCAVVLTTFVAGASFYLYAT